MDPHHTQPRLGCEPHFSCYLWSSHGFLFSNLPLERRNSSGVFFSYRLILHKTQCHERVSGFPALARTRKKHPEGRLTMSGSVCSLTGIRDWPALKGQANGESSPLSCESGRQMFPVKELGRKHWQCWGGGKDGYTVACRVMSVGTSPFRQNLRRHYRPGSSHVGWGQRQIQGQGRELCPMPHVEPACKTPTAATAGPDRQGLAPVPGLSPTPAPVCLLVNHVSLMPLGSDHCCCHHQNPPNRAVPLVPRWVEPGPLSAIGGHGSAGPALNTEGPLEATDRHRDGVWRAQIRAEATVP